MYFYDTNVLLELKDKLFNSNEKFYISSITDKEIENIKTSDKKDEETKYNARIVAKLIASKEESYTMITYKNSYFDELREYDLENTPDNKIIACAFHLSKKEDIIFCTNDVACRNIARDVGLKAVLYKDINQVTEYTGFKEINFSDDELARFYCLTLNNNINEYNLLENEYLIIKLDNKVVGKYKWKNDKYVEIQYKKFESSTFGKIVPKNNDIYQHIAMDSLESNQLTVLRGPAGSGKSCLAFGYMFSLLEKGKIDKIIIFCNTVATKGSAKLGFYPGSRTEKLLDSQIGNLLESKLGGRYIVEELIEKNKLVLLPLSDIRGYDTTGMNAAIYISEAQNLDIELMRLALQRIGEDNICILDGDAQAQVDLAMYAGENNGLRRVSQVFKGQDFYGQVDLQTIYRSKIANIANLM